MRPVWTSRFWLNRKECIEDNGCVAVATPCGLWEKAAAGQYSQEVYLLELFGRGFKGLFFTCAAAAAFSLASLWGVSATAHAASVGRTLQPISIKVQINTQLMTFPDAQPYIDENGRTQVPVRFVSEELGYEVQWEREGDGVIRVHLTNEAGRHLELETGHSLVLVDGEELELNTTPVLRDGRVYVPLRFISEAKGIRVQWDAANFIAILNEDGNYHAPAWYAPQKEFISTFTASAYSADPKENGGYGAVDYFGNPLQLGTVAVDPKVIPLGTKLYIEGYQFDGLPEGGMVVEAKDIGGGVKGNRMDIFIPGSRQSLLRFGLQEIKVYRLSE